MTNPSHAPTVYLVETTYYNPVCHLSRANAIAAAQNLGFFSSPNHASMVPDVDVLVDGNGDLCRIIPTPLVD